MTAALVDTHCHLDFDRYEADRHEVIQRAFEANVAGLINISVDLKSAQKSIEIAKRYPNIWAAVGVHPNDAAEAEEEDIDEILSLLQHPKVVAIGEIGLDYYRNLSPREVQKKAFETQLFLAEELGLPVVIHDREAHANTLEILSNFEGRINGVMHCFSGSKEMAKQCVQSNFYISFADH